LKDVGLVLERGQGKRKMHVV